MAHNENQSIRKLSWKNVEKKERSRAPASEQKLMSKERTLIDMSTKAMHLPSSDQESELNTERLQYSSSTNALRKKNTPSLPRPDYLRNKRRFWHTFGSTPGLSDMSLFGKDKISVDDLIPRYCMEGAARERQIKQAHQSVSKKSDAASFVYNSQEDGARKMRSARQRRQSMSRIVMAMVRVKPHASRRTRTCRNGAYVEGGVIDGFAKAGLLARYLTNEFRTEANPFLLGHTALLQLDIIVVSISLRFILPHDILILLHDFAPPALCAHIRVSVRIHVLFCDARAVFGTSCAEPFRARACRALCSPGD